MPGRFGHKGMIFFLLGVLGLAPTGVLADGPESIIVRASIVPIEGIWVGQRVRYRVDVLGMNGWAKIQRMPDLQVSGAMVLALESQGTRLNETIGGEAYTGQRYELSLFPQRSGKITIPSVSMEIEISRWGAQSRKSVQKGATPPVDFMAEQPPGSEKVPWLISTTQLTAEQRWDPDVKKVAIGEAVRRTVRLSAEDISAMAFSPMPFVGNDSLDVYPSAPEVEDRYDRGTLSGRRTEAVTYLFKKAGRVELPAVTLTWWDLKNRKLLETVLPSRRIEVAPASIQHGDQEVANDYAYKRPWVYAGLVLIVLIALIGTFSKKLRSRLKDWQRKRGESEKAYFKRFEITARSGKPAETLNALMNWLDRRHDGRQTARLDQFLEMYADQKVAVEIDRLIKAINQESHVRWNRSEIVKDMREARKNWLKSRVSNRSDILYLPRLNP